MRGLFIGSYITNGSQSKYISNTNSLYAMVFVLGSSKEDVDVVLHY